MPAKHKPISTVTVSIARLSTLALNYTSMAEDILFCLWKCVHRTHLETAQCFLLTYRILLVPQPWIMSEGVFPAMLEGNTCALVLFNQRPDLPHLSAGWLILLNFIKLFT